MPETQTTSRVYGPSTQSYLGKGSNCKRRKHVRSYIKRGIWRNVTRHTWWHTCRRGTDEETCSQACVLGRRHSSLKQWACEPIGNPHQDRDTPTRLSPLEWHWKAWRSGENTVKSMKEQRKPTGTWKATERNRYIPPQPPVAALCLIEGTGRE